MSIIRYLTMACGVTATLLFLHDERVSGFTAIFLGFTWAGVWQMTIEEFRDMLKGKAR